MIYSNVNQSNLLRTKHREKPKCHRRVDICRRLVSRLCNFSRRDHRRPVAVGCAIGIRWSTNPENEIDFRSANVIRRWCNAVNHLITRFYFELTKLGRESISSVENEGGGDERGRLSGLWKKRPQFSPFFFFVFVFFRKNEDGKKVFLKSALVLSSSALLFMPDLRARNRAHSPI